MNKIKDTLAKAMGSMFTEVSNVSYDLASCQMGIKTDAGLLTLGDDGVIDQNPMDFFSMELPAFAMMTPIAEVKRGDLLVSNGKAYAFVMENGIDNTTPPPSSENPYPEQTGVKRNSIESMNFQGHITRFRPKKVKMMGISDGLLVVKSFGSLFGGESKSGGGLDLQSLMPMMLMSKMGDGKGDMSSMLPLLMMSGGLGGGGGQMNPLMMMMLMGGDSNPFK